MERIENSSILKKKRVVNFTRVPGSEVTNIEDSKGVVAFRPNGVLTHTESQNIPPIPLKMCPRKKYSNIKCQENEGHESYKNYVTRKAHLQVLDVCF